MRTGISGSRWVFAAFCLFSLWACSNDDRRLDVRVITSAVPGAQFTNVAVELLVPNAVSDQVLQSATRPASFGEPYPRGVRVATFGAVRTGEIAVRVTLFAANGAPFLKRRVALRIADNASVDVHLSLECVGVVCPGAGDIAGNTECLGGHCVDPRCNPSDVSTREFCPGVEFCADVADCDSLLAECAEPLCTSGICNAIETSDSESACQAEEWCEPFQGCLPEPLSFADAGVDEDAAIEEDAGITGPTCQVCRNVVVSGTTYQVCDDVPCPDFDGGIDDRDADVSGDAGVGSDAGGPICRICEFVEIGDDKDVVGLVCNDVPCGSFSGRDGGFEDGGDRYDGGFGDGGCSFYGYSGSGSYKELECSSACYGNFCDSRYAISGVGYHACEYSGACGDGGTSDGGVTDAGFPSDLGCIQSTALYCYGGATCMPGYPVSSCSDLCYRTYMPYSPTPQYYICSSPAFASDGGGFDMAGPGFDMGGSDAGVTYNYSGGTVTSGCAPSELRWRYQDNDRDGYGQSGMYGYASLSSRYLVCPNDPAFADNGGDMNDYNAAMNASVDEDCDGTDNDQDGIIDGPKADAACGPSSYCVDAECVHEDDCIEVTSSVSGSIGSELSGVWCSPSNEIVFANTVVIRPDAHIVIARGTTVRMDAATVTVRGRLEFHGTAAEPIVVRSHEDTPSPGDWDTFRTDEAGLSRRFYASYTTFSHARVAFSSQLPVRADHCTFSNNDVVAENGANVTAEGSTFHSNRVVFGSGANGQTTGCEFYGNDAVSSTGSSLTLLRAYVHDNEKVFSSNVYGSTIEYSRIVDNDEFAVTGSGSPTIRYSLIARNGGPISIGTNSNASSSSSGSPVVTSNGYLQWAGDQISYSSIYDNGPYNVHTDGPHDSYMRNNYWGTTDVGVVESRIYDDSNDPFIGRVFVAPILSTPDPETPADVP